MAQRLEENNHVEEFMAEVQYAIGVFIRELGCTSSDNDKIRQFCEENGVEITYDSEYMYILHNGSIVRRFQQPFSTL